MRAIAFASMTSIISCGGGLVCVATMPSSEASRLAAASEVVTDLRTMSDHGIPEDLWNRAECVAVFPSVRIAAFILGGEIGKGLLSCRAADHWSAPAFMELAEAGVGLQAGAQSGDLVLLIMNRRGVDRLLQNKVSLGADVSIAAGPVGRADQAGTDTQASAQILAYSRIPGMFAGLDLSGGVLRPDKTANAGVYGSAVTARDIVLRSDVHLPQEARAFLVSLGRESRATTGRR
jgi:lipid-binding SYLF domain-containing protein